MIEYALAFGFIAVSAALVMNLWRLAAGPTVMDRVVAIDTMVINIIALIILYGIWVQTTLYFESALLLAMFSFISTVACCRFLLRGDVIE
jgi:multicomponent K+:H+ antiporter subunit F